jgi:hypothetical protein
MLRSQKLSIPTEIVNYLNNYTAVKGMDARSFLAEWTVGFLKNRDLIAKKIKNIEMNKDGFDLCVKYSDREQYIIVMPILKELDPIIRKFNNNSYFTIVALNSKDNLQILLKIWNRLIDFKFLNIIFANPFSSTDKKWMVHPHTHHKICDEASLELGLKSMFEMVEPTDEKAVLERMSKDTQH